MAITKEKMYLDKEKEFYIGYDSKNEWWALCSIPSIVRAIHGEEDSIPEPITVAEIQEMLDKDIVIEYKRGMGSGFYVELMRAVERLMESKQ